MKSKINHQRMPTTPGEILSEEFLKPMNMTQKELADHIRVDIKVINRLVKGRTSLSAEMALKLSATFSTTANFWLNSQMAVDIYLAKKAIAKLPAALI